MKLVLAVWLVGVLFTAPAQASCRQALALGLDVSGSVDATEYRLQIDGLAAALSNAEVRAALLSPEAPPVVLAVYEWSGPQHQRLLVDWTAITSQNVLLNVTTQLRRTRRIKADPSTALGTALSFGGALLAQQPACWQHTLDISGDGKANTGPL